MHSCLAIHRRLRSSIPPPVRCAEVRFRETHEQNAVRTEPPNVVERLGNRGCKASRSASPLGTTRDKAEVAQRSPVTVCLRRSGRLPGGLAKLQDE